MTARQAGRALLLSVAAGLALCGCGGGGSGDEPAAPRPGVSAEFDRDNLALVHDELYTCLRRGLDGVLLASYADGRASISGSYGTADFDARLAAPRATASLLDRGAAEYIGVRANTRRAGARELPEWDLLMFPSARRAEQAVPALAAEAADAAQDGIFVRLVKRSGRGDRARRAEAALSRCLDRSRRG